VRVINVDTGSRNWLRTIVLAVVALVALMTLFGSWYTVDQGERAVVLRLGATVGEDGPGLHFKLPWINTVHKITVQNQNRRYTKLETYSRDQQSADLTVSVTFMASDPSAVYSQYGDLEGAVSRLIDPRVMSGVKTIFGQYDAVRAIQEGRFKDEIVPVGVPQRKGDPILVDTDEYPRAGTTVDKLAALKPAFKKEGSVTAGNASGINDGAAALVVTTGAKAQKMGRKPLARILAYVSTGVDPKIMGMGPVPAVRKVLERSGLAIKDVDLFELNEAFAAQSVAVARELGVDTDKVNVNGGAIALGHPIGASGARVLTTLIYALRARKLRHGVAALCIGGGMGIAMAIQNLDA